MAYVFGVDSVYPANIKLKNGYTLYDWVVRKNCFPAFWGRSLAGEHAITKEEVEFLHQRNCKVIPIVNHLNAASIRAQDAIRDLPEIIAAGKKLDIPQDEGVTIFAEIPGDQWVNHNWMISYAFNLINKGYLAGFIGNTDSSVNFNFDREASHYVAATEFLSDYKTTFWATEPKSDRAPEKWSPYCPSELNPEDMDLWRTGKITFDGIVVNENYIRDLSLLNYMW